MRSSLVSSFCIALCAAAYCTATSAQTRDEPSAIAWDCVQRSDESFHVTCIPRGQPPVRGADAAVETRMVSTPRGRDMRPVAQRGDAEVFSAEAWHVPLHSPPTDPEFVRTLLASVLCGKRPACSVQYGESALHLTRR